eukprot:TRINITY_DN8593_c0_g1_i1.p1 TRINITY_DN8593_c0_g1~~TRINITY_DN8593_c0_g1_i1.p1  ORF type:complete len:133 (-),score=31.13 TRINITY_DN8593_c0_g1_i1:411-809(-)
MSFLSSIMKVNALVDFIAVPFLLNGTLLETVYPALSAASFTPFLRRTYAALVFGLGCARLHGGLNTREPGAYRNAIWSYIIECVHFALEIFVFKTATLDPAGIATQAMLATGLMVLLLTKNYSKLIGRPKKE